MIGLYRGKSWVSRLIKLVQYARSCEWSPYSHVSWITPGGACYEAWRKGVMRTDSYHENHTPGTVIDIFDVKGMTEAQEREAVRFLAGQVGMGYDFWQIAKFLSRRRQSKWGRTRWFCSELIAEACKRAGCSLLRHSVLPTYRVRPDHVSWSPLLNLREVRVTQSVESPGQGVTLPETPNQSEEKSGPGSGDSQKRASGE